MLCCGLHKKTALTTTDIFNKHKLLTAKEPGCSQTQHINRKFSGRKKYRKKADPQYYWP